MPAAGEVEKGLHTGSWAVHKGQGTNERAAGASRGSGCPWGTVHEQGLGRLVRRVEEGVGGWSKTYWLGNRKEISLAGDWP